MNRNVLLKGTQGDLPPGLARPSTQRHPTVPARRVALTPALRAQQILKGLYVEKAGVKYALPIDSWEDRTVFLGQKMWQERITETAPLPSAVALNTVSALMVGITSEALDAPLAEAKALVEAAVRAVQPDRFTLGIAQEPSRIGAVERPGRTGWQAQALAWLRDNVHQDIPARYYQATLGHDLHVSTYADLYARHWHVGWASPFDPGDGSSVVAPLDPSFETFFKTHWLEGAAEQGQHWRSCRLGIECPSRAAYAPAAKAQLLAHMQAQHGFVENLGWLSGAKVTTAFVSEEIDELVSTTGTEYADFDSHEVGTSSTAESNAHTALQATTSIARAAGTPTDADPIYRSVATITADATETWEEHGIFNNTTGAAMMDRNLTGGQAVVSSDQVQYTFELTKNAEA